MTQFPEMRFAPTGKQSLKSGQPIYRLLDSMGYQDAVLGSIEVPLGFETDFVSVFGLSSLWRKLFGQRGWPEAVLHDYAYRIMVPAGRCTRAGADDLLERALKTPRASKHPFVPRYLRILMLAAVRANTHRRA